MLCARFTIAVGTSRFRRPKRVVLANRRNGRTQASQVLSVERAQGCRDSSPYPNNPLFHAGPEQRNPKVSANKQARTTHGRRTPGVSPAIKLHLFHGCGCVIHDATSRRNVAVVFLHLRVERMPLSRWM